MARLARLVIPGIPYHVTQRGNRRQQTFFEEADYALYRDLLAQSAQMAGAQVWCYCLMPNHVHIIVVPSDEDGLRRAFADTHRRYTGYINARNRWTGHLWQGRFGAVAMDEEHLAAMRGLRRWRRKPAERSNPRSAGPKSAGRRGGIIKCF
jgi:putative transposase